MPFRLLGSPVLSPNATKNVAMNSNAIENSREYDTKLHDDKIAKCDKKSGDTWLQGQEPVVMCTTSTSDL